MEARDAETSQHATRRSLVLRARFPPCVQSRYRRAGRDREPIHESHSGGREGHSRVEEHLFSSSPGKSRCVACIFIRFVTEAGETLTNSVIEMSRAERLLSYSLLALITSKPLASGPTTTPEEEDEIPPLVDRCKDAVNAEGAWCWRDGCTSELETTQWCILAAERNSFPRLPQIDEIHAKGGRHSPERSGHVRRPR